MDSTKPLSVRAALLVLLDQVDYTADACSVTEMVGAVLDKSVIESARTALAAPFGPTVEQEPKYTVNEFGRIVNRATGIPIPDDEPVMIFRAKDVHVRPTVRRYVDLVNEAAGSGTSHHKDVCFERYQQFVTFATDHPERMKEPDTQA